MKFSGRITVNIPKLNGFEALEQFFTAQKISKFCKPGVLGYIFAISLIFLSLPARVLALSIDEAYKAIPHRQTVFKLNQARMSIDEKEFLEEFFHLVDLAMVERVEMLTWLSTNGQKGREAIYYDQILNNFNSLEIPSSLKEVYLLVVEAVEQQRSFLEEWHKDSSQKRPSLRSDPKVRKANQKLIKAYQILMKLYPGEGQHNKQAFFDYLCALDFI